ncbi:hypothetical protein LguiB_022426 [Lonicera macranthoides]
MEMDDNRPWDALPSLALVNIFQRIPIKDRIQHVQLVCSSWAHASRDPRCWTSMVPDSAVDYAFIKDSKPYTHISVDVYGDRETDNLLGTSRLKTLIQRAHGGGGITALFLYPFINDTSFLIIRSGRDNDDELLRLIAQSCPNLKYLSLYGTDHAAKEAILEVIHSCKKLELVDFGDSPHFSPSILEEMGKCCPNIRGIRRNGGIEQSALSVLTTSFRGRLKLLNLSGTPLLKEDLLTVVSGCPGLQYLDVRGCGEFKSDLTIIQRASAQVVEFFYDCDLGGYWGRAYDSQGDDSLENWSDNNDVTDDGVTEDEDVMDDVSDDDGDDHIADEDEDGDVTDSDDQIADENDDVEIEEEEEEEEEEAEDNNDDYISGSEVSFDDEDDVNNDGYSDSFDDVGTYDNDSFDDDDDGGGDDYDSDDDDSDYY